MFRDLERLGTTDLDGCNQQNLVGLLTISEDPYGFSLHVFKSLTTCLPLFQGIMSIIQIKQTLLTCLENTGVKKLKTFLQ